MLPFVCKDARKGQTKEMESRSQVARGARCGGGMECDWVGGKFLG